MNINRWSLHLVLIVLGGGVLLIYEPVHRSVWRLMFFPGDPQDDGQPGVRGRRGRAKVLPGAGRGVKD